jgi:hypothetical protein
MRQNAATVSGKAERLGDCPRSINPSVVGAAPRPSARAARRRFPRPAKLSRRHAPRLWPRPEPAWLNEVYERRRRRTVRLVELSVAALTGVGDRVSLAAIARVSKTIDPAEADGVS